jgi:ribonuclease D
MDPFQVELHDRLKAWRRRRAEKEGFDASLVLNRHALVRLAREEPADAAALAAVEGLLEWQVERFGDELLACLETFRADRAAGRIEVGPRRSAGRRGGSSAARRRSRR